MSKQFDESISMCAGVEKRESIVLDLSVEDGDLRLQWEKLTDPCLFNPWRTPQGTRAEFLTSSALKYKGRGN